MLVSVIIPAYNAVKFIRSAVYSALNQSLSWPCYEIIVVDDCSTDDTPGTAAFIGTLNEKGRVRVLMKKKNGGPASALNLGIKNAKGDWIHWLSADDVMYPHCLEDCLWHAKDKDTIYYTDYDIIDEKGEIVGEFIEPGSPADVLWKKFFGNGSSSFIHKSVFEKIGLFDEGLPASEDYEFWLRATMVNNLKLQRIPIKTIQYRRHPDQLTNTVGGKYDKNIKASIREKMLLAQG